MNHLQYYLTKLAEEATEVAQIALKTQQFGPYECMPGQSLNNFQRCHQELNDLLTIVDTLNKLHGFGFEPDLIAMEAKRRKLRQFLAYSIQLGLVDNWDEIMPVLPLPPLPPS